MKSIEIYLDLGLETLPAGRMGSKSNDLDEIGMNNERVHQINKVTKESCLSNSPLTFTCETKIMLR